MRLPRRIFLHLAAGAGTLPTISRFAWAQSYPARPVRIIVGFPAGGTTDQQGRLLVDPERHTCTWMGKPVTLTVTEFLILQALASRPGVVKSRNALMDAAYHDDVHVDERTIDSHVKRVRKKFWRSTRLST